MCHHTVSTTPSRYFESSQMSRLLPIPASPMTDTIRGRRSRPVAWMRSLSRRELVVAADERRLQLVAPAAAAALGDDADRPARRDRRLLALEDLVAGGLERDRLVRRALRRLADQHRPGLGDRLEPRGRVDDVAGDHALVRRADRHRRLAGQHAGAGLDPGAEGPDRVDEVERGTDRALGVVLAGDRRAPDGHHGVADELLDRPAVAADDLARELEVARQELARLLGVAALGRAG